MKRFTDIKKRLSGNGKRYFINTVLPDVPLSREDVYIITQDGDRLDNLAYKYYGDTTLWWVIAKANGIKGKAAVSVDEILRIPGNITTILENFRKINRTG